MRNAKIDRDLFKILQKTHVRSHHKQTKIIYVVSKILTPTFDINFQITL